MEDVKNIETAEIREEFSGDALVKCVCSVFERIARKIDCRFKEEVRCGLLTEYPYVYPCIYIQTDVVEKVLRIFPRKKTMKTVILKIVLDDREFQCHVFNEKVLDVAKKEFENLIKTQKEFDEYSIVFKKHF